MDIVALAITAQEIVNERSRALKAGRAELAKERRILAVARECNEASVVGCLSRITFHEDQLAELNWEHTVAVLGAQHITKAAFKVAGKRQQAKLLAAITG